VPCCVSCRYRVDLLAQHISSVLLWDMLCHTTILSARTPQLCAGGALYCLVGTGCRQWGEGQCRPGLGNHGLGMLICNGAWECDVDRSDGDGAW
jgi:hypothetical protein